MLGMKRSCWGIRDKDSQVEFGAVQDGGFQQPANELAADAVSGEIRGRSSTLPQVV